MKKLFTRTMLLLYALIAGSGSVWAADVTYDFTGSGWTVSKGTLSNGNVSFTGQGGANFKMNSGYFMMGKSGAYINFPIYGSPVAKIVVTGNSGASASTKMNIFVGETAVSTETTGSTGTNTYDINSLYQAAGTVYVLKVTSSHNAQITKIEIFYASSGSGEETVSVTGVSLDQSALEMEVGDTETLTATVAPSNASNKAVEWSSDDEDVATVDDEGNVTAVGEGTCTITVTTKDGSKTSTCDVTVNGSGESSIDASVTFDFSTNIFSLPEGSKNKETTAKDYTYNGYTITLAAETNGYYYNAGYLMLGKSGSSLTFPAFPFNVSKIKIHGTSGASESVVQNIYVGEDAVSTATTGAKNVVNEYNIAAEKQAAGTVYVLKVTSSHNTQISKIEVFGYLTADVSSAGWATYAPEYAVEFGEDEAFIIKVANDTETKLTEVSSVPAGTPVLLKGAGEHTMNVVTSSSTSVSGNCLKVSDGTVTNDDNVYVLANGNYGVGFYLWIGNAIPKGKIYMEPNALSRRAFYSLDGEATGVAAIETRNESVKNEVYNFNGQRIAKPSKGLYIVNGKKVIIK